MIELFETLIVWARTRITFAAGWLRCSTFVMETKDGTLPPGLVVIGTYTMLKRESKTVPVVLHNTMGFPIFLKKGQRVARVQTCNEVHQPQLKPGTLEYLEELEGNKPTLNVAERQEMLMNKLDLMGLKTWPVKWARQACELLKEYYDVFLLEDNELGCTSQVKHNIKVTDEEPFKDRFSRIPPPLLEEVRTHMNDMLEAGTIRPSNSPWCNAVILVHKKDGRLCFCIDF